jgi:phytoene dehydrogenase-like protein
MKGMGMSASLGSTVALLLSMTILTARVAILTASVADPIIVVGSGMSGLGAALALAEQGFCNITVLEARDRTGGRTFTDYSLGASAEMGAGWVHGLQNNPVYQRSTDVGIDVKPFSWSDSNLWDENGRIVPDSVYSKFDADFTALKQAVATYANAQVPTPPAHSVPNRSGAWSISSSRCLAAQRCVP